ARTIERRVAAAWPARNSERYPRLTGSMIQYTLSVFISLQATLNEGSMRTIVVGAGPTGLFTAITLARRGHQVVLVDRDQGPPRHGRWDRKGVMQFHHAHTFRGPVVAALRSDMPDVLEDLEDVGATIVDDGDGRPAALLCRRATFDATLRRRAAREPAITLAAGRVDGLVRERGRV